VNTHTHTCTHTYTYIYTDHFVLIFSKYARSGANSRSYHWNAWVYGGVEDIQIHTRIHTHTPTHARVHAYIRTLTHFFFDMNRLGPEQIVGLISGKHGSMVEITVKVNKCMAVQTAPFQVYCDAPQHTATHCNTLRHTATHGNTLQMYVVAL